MYQKLIQPIGCSQERREQNEKALYPFVRANVHWLFRQFTYYRRADGLIGRHCSFSPARQRYDCFDHAYMHLPIHMERYGHANNGLVSH